MNHLKKIEYWLFLAVIFFLPFQTRIIIKLWDGIFAEWTSASLYLTDILIFSVVFLWLARCWRQKRWFEFGKTEIALVVFFAIGGLSLFKAQNFWLGFFREVKLIEMGLLFLYVKNNLSDKYVSLRAAEDSDKASNPPLDLRGGEEGIKLLFLRVFIASGILQALFAIGQFVRQKSFGLSFLDESPLGVGLAGVAKVMVGGEKFIRPYGLAPHPNVLAAFLLVSLFCALVLFTQRNKEFRWRGAIIYGGVLAFLTFALFLTFSRTVIIFGLVAIFSWLIYLLLRINTISFQLRGGRNSCWHVLNTAAIFAACCLLVIIFLWPFLSARFDVETGLADQSFNLRVFYNKTALGFIGENPLSGVGLGNFVPAFQASRDLPEVWMYQPAHNVYLLIASEIGIFGLLAFLAFLFFVIKKSWKILFAQEKSYWLFAVCFLLLIGFFDHLFWDLQQGQLMFWILLGIMAGLSAKTISPYGSTDRAQPSEG